MKLFLGSGHHFLDKNMNGKWTKSENWQYIWILDNFKLLVCSFYTSIIESLCVFSFGMDSSLQIHNKIFKHCKNNFQWYYYFITPSRLFLSLSIWQVFNFFSNFRNEACFKLNYICNKWIRKGRRTMCLSAAVLNLESFVVYNNKKYLCMLNHAFLWQFSM